MKSGVTPEMTPELTAADYAVLADFRHALRRFLVFSEGQAATFGLTPQQHQALLALKAAEPGSATVGHLAERLILKPHSASGLVDRLMALGLLERQPNPADRRQALLRLTDKAEAVLSSLTAIHAEEIRRLRPLLMAMLEKVGS
ncbi:MAG TPA: MarR family transcriptional regulator [Novosphingobium sp.]